VIRANSRMEPSDAAGTVGEVLIVLDQSGSSRKFPGAVAASDKLLSSRRR